MLPPPLPSFVGLWPLLLLPAGWFACHSAGVLLPL
jgi:hypothetical protein